MVATPRVLLPRCACGDRCSPAAVLLDAQWRPAVELVQPVQANTTAFYIPSLCSFLDAHDMEVEGRSADDLVQLRWALGRDEDVGELILLWCATLRCAVPWARRGRGLARPAPLCCDVLCCAALRCPWGTTRTSVS